MVGWGQRNEAGEGIVHDAFGEEIAHGDVAFVEGEEAEVLGFGAFADEGFKKVLVLGDRLGALFGKAERDFGAKFSFDLFDGKFFKGGLVGVGPGHDAAESGEEEEREEEGGFFHRIFSSILRVGWADGAIDALLHRLGLKPQANS